MKPHRLHNLHQLESLLSLPTQTLRVNIFNLEVLADVEVYSYACYLHSIHEKYFKLTIVRQRVEGLYNYTTKYEIVVARATAIVLQQVLIFHLPAGSRILNPYPPWGFFGVKNKNSWNIFFYFVWLLF